MIPVTIFDCAFCKNRRKSGSVLFCDAFPDGIPKGILEGKEHPHNWDECRHGVKFEDVRRPELRNYTDKPTQQ